MTNHLKCTQCKADKFAGLFLEGEKKKGVNRRCMACVSAVNKVRNQRSGRARRKRAE